MQKYSTSARQLGEKNLNLAIADHEINVAEQARELAASVVITKELLARCQLEAYEARDYSPLFEGLSAEQLDSPDLWKEIFSDPNFGPKIIASELFAELPVETQVNEDIFAIFKKQQYFSVTRLSRTVAEQLNYADVVDDWLKAQFAAGDRRVNNVPWSCFDKNEGRKLLDKIIRGNNIAQLDEQSSLFIDCIISAEEYRDIVRQHYQESPYLVTSEIRDNHLDLLLRRFSEDEIREIVGDKYLGLEFSLPILRKLEYSEHDIGLWKEDRDAAEWSFGLGLEIGSYESMSKDDQLWFRYHFSSRKGVFGGKYASFIENDLAGIIVNLPPGVVNATLCSFGRFFYKRHELSEKDIIDGFIKPLIAAQGASAFRALDTLSESTDLEYEKNEYIPVFDVFIDSNTSLKAMRDVMSRTGVRFQDFLEFFIGMNGYRDHSGNLNLRYLNFAKESENIIPFLEAKLPWASVVYKRFVASVKEEGLNPNEAARRINEEVKVDLEIIRKGEWPEGGMDEYRLGLLTHVFPPAVGVAREEYANLTKHRHDRQTDVPAELRSLEGVAKFPLGKWELRANEQFVTTPWFNAARAIAEVNKLKILSEGVETDGVIVIDDNRLGGIGRSMVELLKFTDDLAIYKGIKDAYSLFRLKGGAKLPDVVADRETADHTFEWLRESMRDMIGVAIETYKKENPAEFNKEIGEIFSNELPEKSKKIIIKQAIGIFRSASMDSIAKNLRLKEVFSRAGIVSEDELVSTIDELIDGIEDVGLGDQLIGQLVLSRLEKSAGSTVQPGKLSSFIVDKILGGTRDLMTKELNKWTFEEGKEGGEERSITLAVSKKKMHAVAGLNMGVCVAVDDKLWNKPEFMNVIIFADDGVARGGMHYEIVANKQKTYLSLPGINPSTLLLREVRAEKVLKEMLEFAKTSARAIGAESVLIPTNSVIFSNREELHGLVRSMGLKTIKLEQVHKFSYKPFAYEWQEAYELLIK